MNIYKNKGDRTVCGNYRGISLLSIAGKILSRILLNRLLPEAESFLPESQCGFRPARGTPDMIFVARQLQEKAKEHHCDLHMVFIDLTKAFDSVNRDALWIVMRKFGCPPKFVEIVRQLHQDMQGKVLNEGNLSDAFPVKTGVKQGCVLAPTLFSIFLCGFLSTVTTELTEGVSVEYRIGGLMNIRRFSARTKVSTCTIRELQYADDLTLIAHSQEDLQLLLDSYVGAYRAFGLEVNVGKTQVLSQFASPQSDPVNVCINNTPLQNVGYFKYPGSVLSTSADLDCDIESRLDAASKDVGRLRPRVFDSHDPSENTKLRVYRAVVLPTLLHACETWVLYSRHQRKLELFHQSCLGKLLGVSWEKRCPNSDILTRSNCQSVTALTSAAQLRWTGHINRRSDDRLPKKVLFGQLRNFARRPGGPRKRYKDCIRHTLKQCNINAQTWEMDCLDRAAWRGMIKKGTSQLDEAAASSRREKRRKIKGRATAISSSSSSSSSTYACNICGRPCLSRIGLLSHTRSHQRRGGHHTRHFE